MRWLVCILALLAAAGAEAQSKKRGAPPREIVVKEKVPGFPLTGIRIEGNKLYSERQILDAAGLRVGDMVEQRHFDAARDRLVNSGVFLNVELAFEPDAAKKGYTGAIRVVEVEQVYPYRFEDLPAEETTLQSLISSVSPLFGMKIPGTKEVLAATTKVLTDYLKPKGLEADVVAKIEADGPDHLAIVFRPATAKPVIAQVKFVGAQAVPLAKLVESLSAVAIGVAYSEKALRQLLDAAIRPLYEAEGRLVVEFPKVEVTPSDKVTGLVAEITVKEGPVFQLGKVAIAGSPLDSAELLKIAAFRLEQKVNFDQIEESRKLLNERHRRDGYLKVTSTVERKLNLEKNIADLVVRFVPGPRYTFGSLTLKGLDIHSEPAIRKMWGLKPGDPFDAAYPEYFLKRIKEDRLFDNLKETKSEVKLDETGHTAAVTLTFR